MKVLSLFDGISCGLVVLALPVRISADNSSVLKSIKIIMKSQSNEFLNDKTKENK